MRSPSRKLLDSVFEIPAPEYIVFRHEPAGPWSRMLAVAIDQFTILATMFALTMALIVLAIFLSLLPEGMDAERMVSGLGLFLIMVLFFAINWLYFSLFEWLNRGRTVGKMALGLRVVSVDGTAVDMGQVFIRNLLRVADMTPAFSLWVFYLLPAYAVGAASLFATGRSWQRLGDLAAGTLVVRDRRKRTRDVIVEEGDRIRALSAELNPRTLPSPVLTQGLNDFVSRWRALNPARAEEIARGIEEHLRRMFGARHLNCNALELVLACHYHLYSMSRRDHTQLQGATAQ
ncbi:MAG: RDD family protein [Spirochaetales bacterium]|nr:RDD family protein [Leptospiraceae bacterium]MCP5480263.1 RDD family protein [Spirochaetales bacterium]MCP5486838.1 RDD family protein [Spirochaetales bacterium]